MTNVIEKIKKLLALAQSSNANEAAVAAGLAAKLMAEHRIEQAMLCEDEPARVEEQIESNVLADRGKRMSRWASVLALHVARAHHCSVYYSGGTLTIVGRRSDADAARYLYAFVAREIDRLARATGAGEGKTWANNFRLGAVSAVGRSLAAAAEAARREARQRAAASDTLGTGSALVRVDAALARIEAHDARLAEYLQGLRLRRESNTHARVDTSAFAAGQRAGETINFKPGRPLAAGESRAALR